MAKYVFVAGETVTAARINTLTTDAVSTIGPASVGPFTTTATAIVAAPAVVADGVKKFKITAFVRAVVGTVVTDVFNFSITEVTAGTAVVAGNAALFVGTTAGIQSSCMTISVPHVPAAGSRVYRLDCARAAGTGQATVYDSQIIVEQIA